MKCPWDKCSTPWEKHENLAGLVHAEMALEDAPLGRNGGVACDAGRGPCNCGAWH